MSDPRFLFENEIKLKISQKSKSNQADETALVKYFRYFDLNNSGTVSAEEFQKTLTKIGITSVDNEGMMRLFDYYDTNRNGELDYREFAAAIYSAKGPQQQFSQRSSPDRPTTSQLRASDNQIDEIIINIKRQLRGQGIVGLIGLAKALRLADKYQDKKLEFNEFSDVLRDCHIDLSNRQIERIFAFLNKSGTELMSYEEFLAALKGRLSTNKKAVITQAFHRLDNDRDGHVDIEEIRNHYNVIHHPDVTRGNRSENEVYREFNNALESYLSYKRIRNVSLSSDEFEDLFAFIGASYEDEHHFCTIMNQVWGLNKTQDYSDYKPWAQRTPAQSHRSNESRSEIFAPPIEELEENLTHIFQRFRSRLTFKGIRGYLGIFKLFKNVDYDDDGVISNKEFLKILRDFKMEIPEQDLMYVFAHFDSRKQGQISYEDFMLNVLGSLNHDRIQVVDQAWRKLDVGMAGKIQLSSIKGMFKDLRNHPDVKSGRKYQEQVISDLNDLLDFHHNVVERVQSTFVSKAEFENFLLYISANTEDDKYFEAIIQSIFKLETERNYQDSYAGMAAGRKNYDPTKGYLNDFHRSSQHGGSVSQNAPFGTDGQGRPTSSETSFRDDDTISRKSSQSYTSQQYNPQYNAAPSYTSQYNQPYTTSYSQPYNNQHYGGGGQGYNQTQPYTQQQQRPAPTSNQYGNYQNQYSRQNNPAPKETFAPSSEIPSQRTSFSEKEYQKEREPPGAGGLDEIIRKIRARGIRGILGVVKSLRLLDQDKLKTLPINNFVKALNDYRLDVEENKFKNTLEQYDLVKQGRVDYDAFLNLIKGNLNQRRKTAVSDTYERINEDKKGYVTLDDIKAIYDARGHPDVKSHKREEDEVSMEFLETFDLQHMLFSSSNKGKDKRVSLEEFISYYEIVNCVIEDDKQFETMLTSCFKVYPSTNAAKSNWGDDVSETSSRPQTRGGYHGKF